jgi:hypothetical protein
MSNHLSILLLAAICLCSGCTTTITNEFRGRVTNLNRGGEEATVNAYVGGECTGKLPGGGFLTAFAMPREKFAFYMRRASFNGNESISTNTAPGQCETWIARGNAFDYGSFGWSSLEKTFPPEGAERLEGQVTIAWKSNADFKIRVNLVGGEGGKTALDGEFVGYSKTKFDPAGVVAGFGMLFFGEGRSKTAPAPTHIE